MWFVGVFVAFMAFLVRSIMIIITKILEAIPKYIKKYIKHKTEQKNSKELPKENISFSKSTDIIDRKPRDYTVTEQYECERCLKKISREEYELYDCMCEDCFEDISYKDDGSF